MAKPPETPRPPKRRKRRSSSPKKTATARVVGAVAGAAAFTGVLAGLGQPTAEAPAACGGTERWNVKVANDPDALAGKINLMPDAPLTVVQVNNQIKPGPHPVGGRMDAEKKVYTVRGFLSYLKHEGGRKGDRDYHVVIAQEPGDFEEDERKPPNGRSMVVEFPDPKCFAGKTGGSNTSALAQAVVDARATLEQNIDWPKATRLTQRIPVTVTGVGFFDFDHAQSGRARPRIGADGQRKVFELHPVTQISFDAATDS